MESLSALLSIQELLEAAAVILAGAVAGLVHYRVRKWSGADTELHDPVTIKTAALRVSVSLVFPIVWAALLIGTAQAFRYFTPTIRFIETGAFLLLFLLLFQVLSACVRLLLPERRLIFWIFQMLFAVVLVLQALRSIGWNDQVASILYDPFLTLGPISISLSVVLKLIFLIWVIVAAAARATTFLESRVLKRAGVDPSLSLAVTRFFKLFMIGLAGLVVLDTMGVNLSTLAIFGGALGIGLGFGLQNITSNLVSGWILLLDRSIKQGDVITVGDSYGWVIELGARYIVVRNRDGVDRLIPNANLINAEIINWSHSDRAVRVRIQVGVSYKSDPFHVRQLLLKVAQTNPRVLKKPEPNALLIDFADSALKFELRVWIVDPEGGVESVRSALRFEIWKIFKDHGIEIPYPQHDLHIKSGLEPLARGETPSREIEERDRESSERPEIGD